MEIHQEINDIYASGQNISLYLREKLGLDFNNDKSIELSYDLQSGTYVNDVSVDENRILKKKYTDEMASILEKTCPNMQSLLKGGTGECITLTGILSALSEPVVHVHGFDMCWSRIGYGQKFLVENGIEHVQLCTGTLSEAPFLDNSFQVVVTSHSMEPNGGREEEILKSLHRVSGEWLILFEPSYYHACDEGKQRMDKLGYVKNIEEKAEELGFNVMSHYKLSNFLNPLNPTAVTVIKKEPKTLRIPQYGCPVSKAPLEKTDDGYFSESGMCIYPEIMGLPCLKASNAIIASKYPILSSKS